MGSVRTTASAHGASSDYAGAGVVQLYDALRAHFRRLAHSRTGCEATALLEMNCSWTCMPPLDREVLMLLP